MPQEPIFSAPDPKTSNLFARYTQEQVPVLPSGYLESFATAAKLRADQENQANQLSLERQKMAMTASEKSADRELDYKKTANETLKLQNEADKIANKDDVDYKTLQLNTQKEKMTVFSESLKIARSNYTQLNNKLIDDKNEKDPKKKLPEAERLALIQQVATAQASVNAIGAQYLNHANNFGNNLSGRPRAGSQSSVTSETTQRYAPPTSNGGYGSPAPAVAPATTELPFVPAKGPSQPTFGDLLKGKTTQTGTNLNATDADKYAAEEPARLRKELSEKAYANALARFRAEGGTPGRASERLQTLIDEEQTKLMGQTPEQAAQSALVAKKKAEDEATAKLNARIEARAMTNARAIYDRIPVNFRGPDDLKTIYDEELAKERKLQQPAPATTTGGPVSIFDIPSVDDPTGSKTGPQLSTYNNLNPMSQPVGTQTGVDQDGNPTYEGNEAPVPSELDGAILNGTTSGLKNKNGATMQSTILHNKDTGVFTTVINPNVTGPEYVAHNRKLEFATWVLNKHPEMLSNVKTEVNDEIAAGTIFNHAGNSMQLGKLSKAWKLVRDIEESEATGKYNQNADLISEMFRKDFGSEPNEFWATGRSALSTGVDIDTSDGGGRTKLIQQATDNITRLVANAPKVVEFKAEDDKITPQIADLTEKIATTEEKIKASVDDPDTQKSLVRELDGMVKQVQSLTSLSNSQRATQQNIIDNQNSYNKLVEAQMQIIKANNEVAASELSDSKAVDRAIELAQGFPGYNLESLNQFQGYQSPALKQDSGKLIQIPQMDSKGKPVLDSYGRPLFINKRIGVRENINLSIKNGKYKNIQSLAQFAITPEQKKTVTESLGAYRQGFPAIQALSRVAKMLASKGIGTSAYTKIMGDENNTITWALSQLKSAYRKEAVGGGNPSNYEQELLNDLIPNPNDLLSIDKRNVRRYQNLALMSVLVNHKNMMAAGMELTPQAVEMYNKQLGDAIGRKITKEEIEKMYNVFSENESNYDRLKRNNASEQSLKDARQLTHSVLDSMIPTTPQ